MERNNLEGLQATLLESRPHTNGTRADSSDTPLLSQPPPSSSSVTAVLVFSTLVAVCGSFCYGSAVGYSSPAESGIMQDLGLSVAAYSVFGSIMTVGGMIGAILSGNLSDICGRRRTMWFSELFCTLGWFAIAFSKDVLWADLGRLSIGFGIGLLSYVVPVYVAEIAPTDLRGVFTAFNQLMTTCGFSLTYFLGNEISWRALALVGAIPCLMQLIGLFFIPESPRWLVKIGREKEFETALQRLRGENVDISLETAAIRDNIEISRQDSEARFSDLLQRRYTNSVTVGVGLMLLQQLAGSGAMAYYCSTIFEKADISSSIGTTAVAIIQIPATVVGVLLMDKTGRRPLLLISAGGMCFCCSIIGFSFWLQEVHHLRELTPTLILICLMGLGVASSMGMSGIPWVIMSEIFSVNIKAKAGSLVTLVHWSSSWIMTYTFNFMMQWSSAGTFFLFSGVNFLSVLFISKMVPETKGRTLEEIQATISTSFR